MDQINVKQTSIINELPLPDNLPFELAVLEKAMRYQEWIITAIKPYLGNRILELGAGIGNMSRWFSLAERIVLTESDARLLFFLQSRIANWFSEDSWFQYIN